MKVIPIKTYILRPPRDNLLEAIRDSLGQIPDRSVLAITSKVVSIWQGRCVKKEAVKDKDELIRREAEKFLPRTFVPESRAVLTIKKSTLLPTAGIDESNAGEYYVLWPKNPDAAAKKIWEFLRKTYGVKECGVLITDSHSMPLRRGVVGISIGHFGFKPLKDYRSQRDLFGKKLRVTQVNLADSLAASAVLAMGEGGEQTPLALITDIPGIEFIDREYSPKTPFSDFEVPVEEDLYKPLLESVSWHQGGEEI